MVLYVVKWFAKIGKSTGDLIVLPVLCRNSSQAIAALEYHFFHKFDKRSKYSFDDGEISLYRSKVDSRGFHPHYLMLEKMKEPLDLIDVPSNILRINSIFQSGLSFSK